MASVVLERCELLAGISEEREAITRPYGSQAMREKESVSAAIEVMERFLAELSSSSANGESR